MIAALLQIIDNTKRENHTICLNINGVIFFRRPSVVCRFSLYLSFSFRKANTTKKLKESLKVIVTRVVKENGHY